MTDLQPSEKQTFILQSPLKGCLSLEGPAGSGKTTAGVLRLTRLLQEVPGHQVLVLIPQLSLGKPYQDALKQMSNYQGSFPSILTMGGLARRMTSLFWPLIGEKAGFLSPQRPPHFLSLETAQYCMAKIVDEKLEKGYFQGVTIEKNRIYSQVLDNLNKSALVGFPLEEIAIRLKADQNLDNAVHISIEQAQQCALEFRAYCLEHNLLDYSLQMQTFQAHIWTNLLCQHYFLSNTRHLIYDNIEEDMPISHDLVMEWMQSLESAFLIFDYNGGYRSFLGADVRSAESLAAYCGQRVTTTEPFSQNMQLQGFRDNLSACIQHQPAPAKNLDFGKSLILRDFHFYPEMLQAVADEIAALVASESVRTGEIVVLAPYLSDVLKFSLQKMLEQKGIRSYASRPSRMYLDDPAVKCVLTLAKLAHPDWGMKPTHYEMRHALMVILPEVDIVRADLVAQTLYSARSNPAGLGSFDAISNASMQNRISFALGEKLERMRAWLDEIQSFDALPLDIFLSRLFGELLSQKGFGLYDHFEGAERIAQLIQSIKSFRLFLGAAFGLDDISAGKEFLRTLENGLLPASFISREDRPDDAVLIAPAHTFLMENRLVTCQFWLDIGSLGWWERLNQPLTNPYILRRDWKSGEAWSSSQEYQANQEHMQRVVQGLINRCKEHIYVYSVQVNERGSESRGALLRAFQTLRKRAFSAQEANNV